MVVQINPTYNAKDRAPAPAILGVVQDALEYEHLRIQHASTD